MLCKVLYKEDVHAKKIMLWKIILDEALHTRYLYVASFLPISNSISSLQFSLFDSDTVRKSVNKVIFEIKNIQSSK